MFGSIIQKLVLHITRFFEFEKEKTLPIFGVRVFGPEAEKTFLSVYITQYRYFYQKDLLCLD